MGETTDSKGGRVRRGRQLAIAVLVACLAAGGAWYCLAGRPSSGRWKETVLDLGGGVKMRLVLVPAGRFMMGSPAAEPLRDSNEGPQHEVVISRPFHMGVFEVTQKQYRQVMGADPSNLKGPARPVENVSWDDAAEFCRRLSARTGMKVRLPTEAEWEYACRADSTTAFNTGDTLGPKQANADFSSPPGPWDRLVERVRRLLRLKARAEGTTPAGSFPPNAFGLCDMHGNVWEWCADWYAENYYASPNKTDPAGPASGASRVLRGGGWSSDPAGCRSAFRFRFTPDLRTYYFGFRVAVDSE